MKFNSIEEIEKAGFVGFKKMEDLFCNSSVIPPEKGIYLVLCQKGKPKFVEKGTGGYFKGKEPNVSLSELENNWVHGSIVIYIGKATSLRSRLRQYFGFGQGKNIGHYGGRYIWQIKDPGDLIVCWKALPVEDPRMAEAELLRQFVSQYMKLPFANMR